MAKKNILIIGGGYTGMTAAFRLTQKPDTSVTLVEKSSHLGGLAGGFSLLGTSLEKTYHHLFLSDTSILKLVEELELKEKLEWCNSSVAIYRDGKVHPFMSPMDLLKFKPCGFIGRLRMGLVALYLQKRSKWQPFASQTAHDWMTRACGGDAMNSIWTPLLKGKFDRYYDKVSMAWLWARIHIRANSRAKGGKEKLGYFQGGFDVFTEALKNRIIAYGGKILTDSAVEQFDSSEKRAMIQGKWESFDACVFTGPSGALAQLLPQDDRFDSFAEQLWSINYLGAACLVFATDQEIGDHYWLNINEPDAPFLVFIRHTKLVDKSRYQNKHVYYIGSYQPPENPVFKQSEDEIASDWWEYLKKIHPQFDPSRVSEKHLFRFPAAQHVVDTQYQQRIPEYRTPLNGVYLANFSQIFPEDRGTNYAIREGEKIATMVWQDLTGLHDID